jgi:hypothetical protein
MGTLDEISEVMTYKRLGLLGELNKPVMLYNVNGYYDRFFDFLDDMLAQNFCRQLDYDNVIEVTCIADIERALSAAGVEEVGGHAWKLELSRKVMSMQKADGSWMNENNRFWEADPVLCTSFAMLTLALCR